MTPEEDPCRPPRWMGVFVVLVLIGCTYIGWMVIGQLVGEYISPQEHMIPRE